MILGLSIGPEYYLALSALLFTIGAGGLLIRRNPLVMFMCIELMLNAANLAFISFGKEMGDLGGQLSVLFVLVVAAAEVEGYVSFGARDAYSGYGLCNPCNSRQQPLVYQDLRNFVGPTVLRNTPHMLVKSDAAPGILGAVYDLGWHSEPPLDHGL